MNRFKALLPRLVLVVAGVVVGLLARQVLGPPDENDRPKLTIDRPIGKDVELGAEQTGYVPIDLPVAKLPAAKLPVENSEP